MKNTGYFERTTTMVFGLQGIRIDKKIKKIPVIFFRAYRVLECGKFKKINKAWEEVSVVL